MYTYEANLARAIVADRIREANQRGLGRELKRREQPSPAATAVQTPRRPSRLWKLAHLRQAYT
jgi:hypothetical protein